MPVNAYIKCGVYLLQLKTKLTRSSGRYTDTT